MKLGTLVRIELIKTLRRKAFWLWLGFLTLIATIGLGSDLVTGQRGNGPPFVPPFAWSMSIQNLGPMPGVFLSLAVIMLITSEYGWRTARQNVIDGLSKEQFFTAKWLMTLMVTLAFVGMALTVSTSVAVYGRLVGATPDSAATVPSQPELLDIALAQADSARNAARPPMDSARAEALRVADSTQAALREAMRQARQARPRPVFPPVDDSAPLVSVGDLRAAAGFTLGTLGFASIAFLLAMLLRSTGGATGVFFVYFGFVEQLLGLLLRRTLSEETALAITRNLPVSVFRGPLDPRVWHPEYLERINAIGASMGQAPQSPEVDMVRLVVLPLTWILVFAGASFLVFRRRDL